MNLEEIKRRFVQEIKLRAYDDRYVDRAEEKEILKIAIQFGISLDSARDALLYVCEHEDYTLESFLEQRTQEVLEQFASNDGKIDKKEFFDAAALMQKLAKGRLNESECRRRTKAIVIAKELKVKEGFLKGGNWFASV
ncbi:hypothetical protein TI04_00225 [Achromatium sp. WMS2]|nr:hypothetical protein TI04_00225 [Achromatium sp. WMS2]